MGDFSIKISSELIKQLSQDNDQPKKKAKRTKPKVVQPKQPKTHHDAAGKPSSPSPAAEFPPFFYPVPQQQAVMSAELESIKSVVEESVRVLEKVEKQAEKSVSEVTERAKDLREKEFKIPEPKPMPCSSDHDAWTKCYKENIENPLKCSGLVRSFQDCARRFRQKMSSE